MTTLQGCPGLSGERRADRRAEPNHRAMRTASGRTPPETVWPRYRGRLIFLRDPSVYPIGEGPP